MNKHKILSILCVLVLALGIGSAPALAQGAAPVAPPILGLDKPSDKLTDADLAQFVTLARQERVTVAQAQAFLARLSPTQAQIVSDQVGIQAGIPLDRWRQGIAENQKQRGTAPPAISQRATPQAGAPAPMHPNEAWAYTVANYNGPFPPDTQGVGWYYGDSYSCDPYPDYDYIFGFSHDANNQPALRWNTNSSQVYTAFWSYYGGNLRGWGFNYSEVRLCAGEGGVWAAGGAGNVAAHLFVHYI